MGVLQARYIINIITYGGTLMEVLRAALRRISCCGESVNLAILSGARSTNPRKTRKDSAPILGWNSLFNRDWSEKGWDSLKLETWLARPNSLGASHLDLLIGSPSDTV